MNTRQILFVVSGPSGSGKETVIGAMVERLPALERIVTYTTRAPRQGEAEGHQYHFISDEHFARLQSEGEIFESEMVYGSHRYGSPRRAVAGTASGDLIMELDPQGFLRMRQARTSPTVGLFLFTPDVRTLEQRIQSRAVEKDLGKRLAIAREQLALADAYDYLVVNRDREKCLAEVQSILTAERIKHHGPGELERIRAEFEA